MSRLLLNTFFSLIFFFPCLSHAFCLPQLQPEILSKIYLGGVGGISGGYDLKCKKFETSRGYYVGIKMGREFFFNWRLEEEATWQANSIHSLSFPSTIGQIDKVRGHINILSLMTNLFFDFNLPYPGSPYVGVGVGYAHISGSGSGIASQTNEDSFLAKKFTSTIRKERLAWQLIAGLDFSIWGNLKAGFEYRFFKSEDLNNHKIGLNFISFF